MSWKASYTAIKTIQRHHSDRLLHHLNTKISDINVFNVKRIRFYPPMRLPRDIACGGGGGGGGGVGGCRHNQLKFCPMLDV
jgi:hypothetical protein